MKVLVTGANGQLGYDVVRRLKENGIEHIGAGRNEFDITDETSTKQFIENYKPDVVIHCAAYTAVDKAESERELCYRINVLGTRYVAEACKTIDAKMVYISTDYVFDGEKGEPYEVTDQPNPINYYGQTKYEGELEVQRILTKYFIVRTSWVFGIHGNNFVKTILRLAEEEKVIRVVDDQVGSPTYAYDLAGYLIKLIGSRDYGIHHATNQGSCNWYEFALEIKKIWPELKNTELKAINSEQRIQNTPRPANSQLKMTTTQWIMSAWKDALARYYFDLLNQLKEQYKPLVSVIIPVYQVEKYIRDCIHSVINQSYLNLDIILVDDGSMDNSGTICDEYSRNDERIRVIHKENAGLSSARNVGLQNSLGEYILFVDSDDVLHLKTVENSLGMIMYYAADICEFDYKNFHNYDTLVLDNEPLIEVYNIVTNSRDIVAAYIKNNSGMKGVIWNKMYKRGLFLGLERTFFHEGMVCEDAEIIVKLLWNANKYVMIKGQPLYFYRQRNDGNITANRNDDPEKRKDAVKALKIQYETLKDIGFSDTELSDYLWEISKVLINSYYIIHKNKVNKSRDPSEVFQIVNRSIMNEKRFYRRLLLSLFNYSPPLFWILIGKHYKCYYLKMEAMRG